MKSWRDSAISDNANILLQYANNTIGIIHSSGIELYKEQYNGQATNYGVFSPVTYSGGSLRYIGLEGLGVNNYVVRFTENDAGTLLHSNQFIATNFSRVFIYPSPAGVSYNNYTIQNSGNFTIRLLIKLSSKADTMPIFWAAYPGKVRAAIWYDQPTDRFVFGTGFDAADFTVFNTASGFTSVTNKVSGATFGSPSTGAYYQIIADWDSLTSAASIRINSSEDSASFSPDSTDAYGSITLGTVNYAYSGGAGLFFNGFLSELTTWTRLLTPTEKTALYNAGTFKTWPYA